ncbi:mitochondrial 37S ribosomal protein uS5m [Limtongia smithiae]|uniref:mitochondrial 37S ribosomal protein uS5m n=1 Tax=Limtongia smithiae TaxID=1125753 RepID=UPI0034CE7484
MHVAVPHCARLLRPLALQPRLLHAPFSTSPPRRSDDSNSNTRDPTTTLTPADAKFPTRTTRADHIRELAEFYSPRMLKSIVAAERAVTPDMWAKLRPASSTFPLSYVDDLTQYDKFWDIARHPWEDVAADVHQPVPPYHNLTSEDIARNATAAKEASTKAPAKEDELDADEVNPEAAAAKEAVSSGALMINNKLSDDYIRSLRSKVVVSKTVANVTKLGKMRSQYVLVVVGDQNGMIGYAEAKDRDNAMKAVIKARAKAISRMVYIPRFENRTIYSAIDAKFHGVSMTIWPRQPGFGLRTNHIVQDVASLAGIRDLSGKVRGSRNKMNTVKCVIAALQKQVLPEEIAMARGKKIRDVREVYFGEE